MPNISPVERVAWRSPTDRLRLLFYLVRVDWYLEGAARSTERKAAIRSLREELEGDPRDIRTALKDLGPPNALAARYAEEGQRSPMWSIGIIIAGVALLVYWIVFLSFASGMLAVVDSKAPGQVNASFLYIDVTVFSNSTGIGVGWSGWTWLIVPVVIVTIAFLLGARSWRLARPASQQPQ